MNDKFTIRDFLVYFLTGLFLLLILLYLFKDNFFNYFSISKTALKDNSVLLIFLLLPGLYLLGHFIHGLDYLLFKFGRGVWNFKKQHTVRLRRLNMLWLLNFLNFTLSSHRITGKLNSMNIDPDLFWKSCSKLISIAKYEKADYWNLMHALFEGVTFVCILFIIYSTLTFDRKNCLISAILCIVFWSRSRHMAENFISTVNNAVSVHQPELPLT